MTGGKIKLECVAQGSQPIRYEWRKNGKPLTHRKYKAEGPVLKINSLLVDDAGNYTCIASNEYGSSTCDYAISVYGTLLFILLFIIIYYSLLTSLI